LNEAGARVIAFDVLFADPTSDDAGLAEAMSAARNVVEPVAGSTSQANPTTRSGEFIRYDQYTYPTPTLREAARIIGHVNVVPDSDGQVRQVPLILMDGDTPVPALGLAAMMLYLRMPVMDLIDIQIDQVSFPMGAPEQRVLYTDDIGQMNVYYFGPPTNVNQPGTFPVYSLVDVLNGYVPPEAFKDKIVLIGALDTAGEPDSYATPSTPTGKKMFGVEIHANIIETIHQSLPTAIMPPGETIDWTLPLREQPVGEQMAITFLLALGAGLLLPFLRWYLALPVSILTYVAYYTWVSSEFRNGRILEILFPAQGLTLTFVGTMIVVYLLEERRRGQINDLFSRYVSPEIAQKIVEAFDHGQLNLGGEEREITVLFADIRGFTTLSEGLTPPEVVSILNVFLERMNTIVMGHGGAINKYIGDNLMAFWNAPYPQEDHAWLATQAGVKMLEAINDLNQTRQFTAPVQFGIGINTGPVVVGNVGSQRRLEYTPIGDTVNTASRLCGVAPGGSVYIGRRTLDLIGDRATPAAVHHLKLKGKAEPVEIHELRIDGAPGVEPDKTPEAVVEPAS
jgi:adenylate cyclase